MSISFICSATSSIIVSSSTDLGVVSVKTGGTTSFLAAAAAFAKLTAGLTVEVIAADGPLGELGVESVVAGPGGVFVLVSSLLRCD